MQENTNEYTFDDVKNIVTNMNLNWQYLNKEKQQFLEQFVKKIKVEKYVDGVVKIDSVEFVGKL